MFDISMYQSAGWLQSTTLKSSHRYLFIDFLVKKNAAVVSKVSDSIVISTGRVYFTEIMTNQIINW